MQLKQTRHQGQAMRRRPPPIPLPRASLQPIVSYQADNACCVRGLMLGYRRIRANEIQVRLRDILGERRKKK